jgi:methionyl-tRNA formyltransferase
MKELTLAYFGTPDFSARLLKKLIQDKLPIKIKSVFTQPDKPVGRKQIMTPSPVKIVAEKNNIPVFTNDVSFNNHSHPLLNVELGLLYAYGKIIPKPVIAQPKFGFWNIHPSLLPKYRGPSPIAFSLINGEQKTGVTLMQMDEELDHGPIIDQQKLIIAANSKRPDLENQLTDLGYQLLKKNLLKLITNRHPPPTQAQDHSQATYTRLLKKEDGYVKWQTLKQPTDPQKIYQLFRGLYPWPGIWTRIRIGGKEKRLKIIDLNYYDGKLILKTVQLEGKKPVDFKTFIQAYNLS